MRSLIALLLFALCVPVQAEKIVVIHKGLHYIVELGEPATVAKTEKATDPVDPKDPEDPLSKAVVKAARDSGAKPLTVKALSTAYSRIAAKVRDKSIKADKALSALKAATDAIAKFTKDEGLDTLRASLGKILEAQIVKTGDVAGALDSVAKGLDAHLEGAGLLDDIDWEQLIKLIIMLIELFAAFG